MQKRMEEDRNLMSAKDYVQSLQQTGELVSFAP